MDVETAETSRSVSFSLVVLGLVILGVGLGAMVAITTRAAMEIGDEPARKLLVRLAWISVTLLLITVLLLVWAVMRHIRYRLHSLPEPKPSQYVNAWELAGKRFKLEDGERDDEDSGEAENGDDEPQEGRWR